MALRVKTTLILFLILTILAIPIFNVKLVHAVYSDQKFESQEINNVNGYIYGQTDEAQTFTPTLNHTVTTISLYSNRYGSSLGLYLNVSIYKTLTIWTSYYGCPDTVSALFVSGNVSTSSLGVTAQWNNISMNNEFPVVANVTYAIVTHLDYPNGTVGAGNSSAYIVWTGNIDDTKYLMGNRSYTNSGLGTSFPRQSQDHTFIVYGKPQSFITFITNDQHGYISSNQTLITNNTQIGYFSGFDSVSIYSFVINNSFQFKNMTFSNGTVFTNNPLNFSMNFDNMTLTTNFDISSSGGTPFITARFTFNNSAPYQGDPILFNGTSSNASSTITSFLWNFGDNGTVSGNETTHIYNLDGIFLVNLTVVSGSMINSMLQNITVLSTTINLTFDWNDILFGSGAWIAFIVIMAIMFFLVAVNKYFIVVSFPIMVLMGIEYLTLTTGSDLLVWQGLIMIVSSVILALYSLTKK